MEVECGFCGSCDAQKRCSRCKVVIYCNREHQSKHWKIHKLTCMIDNKVNEDNSNATATQSSVEVERQQISATDTLETKAFDSETTNFDLRPFKRRDFMQPKGRESEYQLSQFAAECLKLDGYCVIDNIISEGYCERILKEVETMNQDGLLRPAGGSTSGDNSTKVTNESIRSDKITWIEGTDKEVTLFPSICGLMGDTMDIIVAGINTFLDKYSLRGRTKAMVACYPGNGTAYKKHIDNPSKDGRLITCIVYLNKDWDVETQGGLLRIFPSEIEDCVDIEPIMGRMVLFWSDSRNPHEVQPAYATRYAITMWYFDGDETEKAKEKKLEEEMAQIRGEVALTEIETKKAEREIVEKKIAYESVKAMNLLTEDELEAISTVVGNHPYPRAILTSLGIASSIQDILMPEIQRRNAQN